MEIRFVMDWLALQIGQHTHEQWPICFDGCSEENFSVRELAPQGGTP